MRKITKQEEKIIEEISDLDEKKQLQLANDILDNICNCFYIDGYIKESNEINDIINKINKILGDE